MGHPIDFLKVGADFDLLETDGAGIHIKEEHLQEDFHLSASLMNLSMDKDIDVMGLGGMNGKRQMLDTEGKQLSLEEYTNHFLQQMSQAANQKAGQQQQQQGLPTVAVTAAAVAAAASFRERKPQELSLDCAVSGSAR